jgi:oligoendopeptidase F
MENKIKLIKQYEGTLSKGPDYLLGYLKLTLEMNLIQERLLVYAKLRHDENTKDTMRQELLQRIQPITIKISKACSFFIPELLDLDIEVLNSYYLNEEILFFKKYLDKIVRAKPYQLSKKQEKLLSQTDLLYSASHTFTMLDNADIIFDPVIDENGNKISLTNANSAKLMASENRAIRKMTFSNIYKSYGSLINTLASTYLGNVKKDLFYSQVRNYSSSLEQAMFENDVNIEVYSNLIAAIKDHQPLMHRYIAIRKKAMDLQELHMYDIYAPLVPNTSQDIPYEEAYDIMLDGLSILGDQYISILKEARNNRWIDVYPNDGKMSGAYQWGTYGTHPYVLLNYRNDLNSLFTLAHEMGHALHTYYSDHENHYLYAEYVIFVAEVASTVNEVILMYHLLKETGDPAKKRSLINYFLELFKGKIFRQTMFAEFEKIVHEKVQNDEPLTSSHFSEIYYQLNQDYYGNDIIHDNEIRYEWARIPHFYRSFYVYQYATGFTAAIAIAKRIMDEGDSAVRDYLTFLKSGGTDSPLELLKIAGVDMTSTKPFKDALEVFQDLLDQFEELLKGLQ